LCGTAIYVYFAFREEKENRVFKEEKERRAKRYCFVLKIAVGHFAIPK